MKTAGKLLILACCAAFVVYAALFQTPGPSLAAGQRTGKPIDFNRDIKPIFAARCIHCHGEKKAASQLRLDDKRAALKGGLSGVVIAPGQSRESRLLARILGEGGEQRMPLGEEPLGSEQIKLIQRWIDEGAVWPDVDGETARLGDGKNELPEHWAYVKPIRPPLPDVKNKGWVRNPIDRFILARLEREGLSPAPEASKETLIRRVSLDLTGLPPTPEEIDAFLRDRSPQAYERVVDRLLNSPRYGERMAARWLDAARYADTNGYQSDEDRQMWRWRDWVIEAFNRNLPFDQFTIQQIAGDLLAPERTPEATLDQRLATGFNRNHRINSEDGIIYDEYAVEYVVDRVDTTATVFLGMTIGCARCHNHKYDPVTQKEYYQLFAYFNNIPEYGRAIRGANSPPVMPAPTREQQRQLRSLNQSLVEAEKRFASYEAQLVRAKRNWEESLTRRLHQNRQSQNWTSQHWFPSTALVAHFSFDESKADARETGDHFEQGTIQSAPGQIGRAAKFDGRSTLEAGQFANFSSNDRFTLAAWVYPESEHGGVIIARAEDTASQTGRSPGAKLGIGYGLRLEEGKVHFNLVHDWADDAIRVAAEERLEPGKWHHVLATYDGSRLASGAQIYLDGMPQKLKVDYGLLIEPIKNKEPLRIGGDTDSEQRFHGLIDEVRIYDKVLSPSEIAVLASSDSLEAIAKIPSRERAEAQRDKLLWAFLDKWAPQEVRLSWRRVNELKEQKRKLEESFPTVMVMRERETTRETFVLKRGAYDAPGEKAQRGVPAALPPMPEGAPNNRLGLARWLTHPSNPLTSRVTVNRFWQMLFGVGLVKTTEDFGLRGERPSHPELLDWLAVEFRDGATWRQGDGAKNPQFAIRNPQWDVKALLKTIVMSATYRQSAKPNSQSASGIGRDTLSIDPENRLLARAPRLRLPAEMIRDQALLVSGLLVERLGGPSVKPYQPDGVWNDLINGGKYVPDTGGSLYRRSLYTYWKRTIAPPFMSNFDAANRESCVVRESRTNTPLQALNLMNDVTYIEAARMLAERALLQGGGADRDRVRFAFRLATSRWPDEHETRILLNHLRAQLEDFAKDTDAAARLLGVGAKPTDRRLNAVEVAAYATVASLILNLDEVITKE
jgi:mono/diheme cytochrome c family protein